MRFSSKSRAACFYCTSLDLLICIIFYVDQITCRCWGRQSADARHAKSKSDATNLHGAGASNLTDNIPAAPAVRRRKRHHPERFGGSSSFLQKPEFLRFWKGPAKLLFVCTCLCLSCLFMWDAFCFVIYGCRMLLESTIVQSKALRNRPGGEFCIAASFPQVHKFPRVMLHIFYKISPEGGYADITHLAVNGV